STAASGRARGRGRRRTRERTGTQKEKEEKATTFRVNAKSNHGRDWRCLGGRHSYLRDCQPPGRRRPRRRPDDCPGLGGTHAHRGNLLCHQGLIFSTCPVVPARPCRPAVRDVPWHGRIRSHPMCAYEAWLCFDSNLRLRQRSAWPWLTVTAFSASAPGLCCCGRRS